jgi:small neutral amino acid transporter SnatA (MarC family)
MGPLGTMVMMRMAAFILLCIGIDMLWAGGRELSTMR